MSNTVTVYGIANCDSIKKARKWLTQQGIEFEFHDYRANGIDTDLLGTMTATLGWETLLNRRGTTWRKLPEQTRDSIDADLAFKLMLEHPAMIKRPVMLVRGQYYAGFDEQQYQQIFNSK